MHGPKEQWIKDLPRSRMVYPTARTDKLKYWFWRVYTPLHPLIRNASYRLGIGRLILRRIAPEMERVGRQNFLLGQMNPAYSVQEFVSFLISQGFGNHFIAWEDADELVSLRRTVDFKNQYHLRIFRDGEVRCHYEYTPECHPFLHLVRIGFEDRREEFRSLLRDRVLPPGESATTA